MKYFLENKHNHQKMNQSIHSYIFYFAHFQILGIVSMLAEVDTSFFSVKVNI